MLSNQNAALADRVILIHKHEAEGSIQINALTGIVVTPLEDRPEWASGLACALHGERLGFWSSRLGPQYAESIRAPEAAPYEDFGWAAIDEDGNPIELDADIEHRMTQLAEITGVHRDADLSHGKQDDTTGEQAHILLDMGTKYDQEEAHALEQATKADFGEDSVAANG